MKFKGKDEVNKFKVFLIKQGAEVISVTNEYEIIRFKCEKGTGIVYENKRGNQTFCGPAQEAYEFFKRNQKWSCIDKVARAKRSVVMDEIIERDGEHCFYCGEKFDESDANKMTTLEHLHAISAGGNNHINNLVLAHRICNTMAADMSLIDKIKLRESILSEKE